MTVVTFIIPSKGRPTLTRTLHSLRAQTDQDWKAIVAFDGIDAIIDDDFSSDERITLTRLVKRVGQANHGGLVRNYAMGIADTPWLAFVDDDDSVTPDYVARLNETLGQHPDCDVVIFRMQQSPGVVLPPPGHTNFSITQVGISFAMKRKLFVEHGYAFVPGIEEDFHLLNRIRAGGCKIVISPHLTYLVRS
jgi:glycosyltransferase involved in cell wall biosynthesis